MDTKQKKLYQKPTMDIVWLDVCMYLLAGSGETEVEDPEYGGAV